MPLATLTADRARQFAVSIWCATILLAALMLSRRLAGAFEAPPPGLLVALVSALLFIAGAFAAWLALQCQPQVPSPPRAAEALRTTEDGGEGRGEGDNTNARRLDAISNTIFDSTRNRFAVTTLAVLPPTLFGLAVAGSGATGTQMSILTLAVATAYVVVSIPLTRQTAGTVATAIGESDSVEEFDPQDESQHTSLIRRWSDDGEILEGTAVAEFAPGQKLAVIHVAFCPPTLGTPRVECEPLANIDVRWKLAVAQTYGLRIDVTRRGNLEAAESVPIAYFATATANRAKAA